MSFQSRVTKLEQTARTIADSDCPPGIPDELAKQMRQVAATVGKWQDLEAYIATLESQSLDEVVSLEDRRRSDAVRKALARSVFDEVHSR